MNTTFASSEQIMSALQWRYAVKRFDANQQISDQDWKTLQESLRLAPSSYGLQAWKFIHVKTPALRAQLREVSWNQSQITDASQLLVLVYKKKITEADVNHFIDSTAQIRGIPTESMKGFADTIIGDVVKGPRAEVAHIWTQRQVYIAMGFLLETAALLKIDACPMEGINPVEYDKLLGLDGTEWATVATVTLGYRHAEDSYQHMKKARFSTTEVFEVK